VSGREHRGALGVARVYVGMCLDAPPQHVHVVLSPRVRAERGALALPEMREAARKVREAPAA
jgi:hypothetical protein